MRLWIARFFLTHAVLMHILGAFATETLPPKSVATGTIVSEKVVSEKVATKAVPKKATDISAQLILQDSSSGLTLELYVPLMALLGELDDAGKVMEKLQHPDKLWMLPKSAQCTAAETVIQSDRLAQLLERQSVASRQRENSTRPLGSLPRELASPEIKDNDVKATFVYRCVKPELLKGMHINVMQVFPAIGHVEIQMRASKVQSGYQSIGQVRLASPGTRLDW